MTYYEGYFTIYINLFIYPRQDSRHYNKFTLTDKINVSNNWKIWVLDLYFTNESCCLIALLLRVYSACVSLRRVSLANLFDKYVYRTRSSNSHLCLGSRSTNVVGGWTKFVTLDQKQKCELLHSCSVYMFAEHMANDTCLWLAWYENIFDNGRVYS